MKRFCIALGTKKRRFIEFSDLMNRLGLPFEHYEAFDASSLTETSEERIRFIDKSVYVSKGMIGCTVSHIRLWDKIIAEENDDEIYEIYEDDARIIGCLYDAVTLENFAREHDVVLLHIHGVLPKDVKDGFTTMNNVHGISTCAYMLSRKGAMKMRNHVGPNMESAIDRLMIKMGKESVLDMVAVAPCPVAHSGLQSTIATSDYISAVRAPYKTPPSTEIKKQQGRVDAARITLEGRHVIDGVVFSGAVGEYNRIRKELKELPVDNSPVTFTDARLVSRTMPASEVSILYRKFIASYVKAAINLKEKMAS